MKNQASQDGSQTESDRGSGSRSARANTSNPEPHNDTNRGSGSRSARANTSNPEPHSDANRGSESAPLNTSDAEPHGDSPYNSDLRIRVETPPFARYMRVDSKASFKQYMAVTAAYSIGKSLLDTWNSSTQTRERRRRSEAEQREREAREAREAAEERERRERERREALERLMQDLGIDISDPVISEEDKSQARRDIGYEQSTHNIVFAGKLNAGKSSLINAIRNRNTQDEDYAPTGASEVTLERHRYPDPIHAGFIWYDTRGSGTESVTAYDHYYSQQLYAYDLVVLVHDSTLTRSDIRILQVCHLMRQPWLAVRTKCDMHIRNYEIERDWDTETAKAAFLAEVRDDVSGFTQQAEASENENDFATQFRDFVVSAPGIRRVIRGQTSELNAANAFVDEVEFLQALGLPYGVADDVQ